MRIANELLMLFRSRKKNGREVSLYEPIGTDKEGNEISLLDILESSDGDIAEAMDFRKNLRRLYKIFDGTLTEREKRVLILRYGMFGGEGEDPAGDCGETSYFPFLRFQDRKRRPGKAEKAPRFRGSIVRRSFPAQGPEVPQKRYLQIFHL